MTAVPALRNWRQLLAIRNWRPRLRARHGVRVAIVLTAASFWAVAVLLYGPKRSLFAASAWFVALAIKDATNIRVRGPSDQVHGWAGRCCSGRARRCCASPFAPGSAARRRRPR